MVIVDRPGKRSGFNDIGGIMIVQKEVYTHGYGSVAAAHLKRSADKDAAFFLPHLRPGMRLLDCGCGPGAIALGLAAIVSPGETVGVDVEPSLVEQARALAAERGVANVRFEVGSAYDLPFPDGSFDAVFANMVLHHLREPVTALREMRRVLKPGGIVGVRDSDYSCMLITPPGSGMEQFFQFYLRVWEENGGSPRAARFMRGWLREAGFTRTEASATVDCNGTLQANRSAAAGFSCRLGEPDFVNRARELGLADEAVLHQLKRGLAEWAEDPDSMLTRVHCEAVGWLEASAPEHAIS
jgi:ubiquinone/menaquinone biosynthesis C-methylase UbiE